MSNVLAIATVTAAIGHLLQGALAAVPGAKVTNERPVSSDEGDPRVNVYLYRLTPNPAWRNEDLPTRAAGGRVVERPLAALDLHYLLSFYGDEATLEPQRLAGSVLSTLHARPLITRGVVEAVRAAAADVDAGDPRFYLADADLDAQPEAVRLIPYALDAEELAELYSVFFDTPLALSVAYTASVVLIEADETPAAALPVRERTVRAVPSARPVIERVAHADGPQTPIVAGSMLAIDGAELGGEGLVIRFGDIEAAPASQGETRATVVLPAGLRPGVRSVQALRRIDLGSPRTPHGGVRSNVATFVLRPEIRATGGGFAITVADASTEADGTVSAQITVGVRPEVGARQRASVLLSPLAPASGGAASFPAAAREVGGDELTASVRGVAPGAYLVRIQVDGAESPLRSGAGGAFDGPAVTLP